ncbi:FAD/NAD(P)-binding domain-containing protein [Trametopsis cervina]|nr:FAD/NAD(P)-binding domain-containing protein [Trametopsis cervina]
MAAYNPPTKVIVIGAGVAGPVLATFLKLNGYHPVIYERVSGLTDGGLAHVIQPNGKQVLSKIPGLVESLPGIDLERTAFYSVLPEDKGLLAQQPIPSAERLRGLRRAGFHKALVDAAVQAGVEIKWGHKLVSLEQSHNSVTVTFENGTKDTGSFVVGCDGLHSNTRKCLFGEEKAEFTGLCQTGGVSPTPVGMRNPPTLVNIFGNGKHIIAYPISDTHCDWAYTSREPEAKETWRAQDDSFKRALQNSELAGWDFGGGKLVQTVEHVVKYGLYDRPELKTWHEDRVVLIGDAAHPTSPHLGQGANQAFEDIDHLITLLKTYNPSASSPPTLVLESLFTELESQRIPRSSAMVKGARAQGESRVVQGTEECIKRNQAIRERWSAPQE